MIIRRILRVLIYTFLLLLLLWIIAVQAGWMDMRIPDVNWPGKLREKGQSLAPEFWDIPSSSGRTIHSITVRSSDSLPWIILLHGSPGSMGTYVDYLADTSLTDRANLIAMDRAGFGYSDYGHAEPSLQRQAADVKAVVDRVAPGRKVFLVGYSLGGPVICRFAMDYPDQTAGIVNVAGSVDADLELQPWWQQVMDVPPMKWLLPGSLWASNHEIRYLADELRLMIPLWPQITCPVALVHAQDDQLVPVSNVDFCKKMLSGAARVQVTVLPTGDHFILWNRRDVVKAAIFGIIAG